MTSRLWALVALIATLCAQPLCAQSPAGGPSPELAAFLDSLHPRRGRIAIPEAKASLNLGERYEFYGPADARKILVDLWGNPPSAADGVLGLVMPVGSSPAGDSWGAVISFEATGYVADDDAESVDYDDLLKQLQEQTADNNEARKQDGYPAMRLVGWAERPDYDAGKHAVVWAQDLAIEGGKTDTLNYDVRSLGRYGVLSMNLISGMDQLGATRAAAHAFASHAQFDPGARYTDYNASTDQVAEYGIGGLVATGAGLAVAKKLGLLALVVKFLKPLGLALFVGFAFLRGKIARLFGRGETVADEGGWDDRR